MSRDLVFPSANEYGVPDLLFRGEAGGAPALEAPLAAWGSVARSSRFSGTWHFYVDDYRFSSGLMSEPLAPVRTGASSLVEPNYSIFDESPRAVAIWRTYQKRWVARCWQSEVPDLPIWADVCFSAAHEEVGMLGVPFGWRRFATAGFDRHAFELDQSLERAVERSAGESFTLLVYGGGDEVDRWCSGRANVLRVRHRRSGESRPGAGTRAAALRRRVGA